MTRSKNAIDIAKLLLEKGANVNIPSKGNKKESPLYKAILQENIEMVKLLLGYGALVNEPGPGEVMPLSVAAANGNIEMANLLLKHGANINKATTADRITALHNAVAHKQKDMITLLIKNGAKVDIKTPKGKSILDTAKATKNENIIDLIQSHIPSSCKKRA